jgi:hypothetical protein
MLPLMEWDGLTPRACAGVAAVIISGVLLLAGIGAVVPLMGVVAGVAVMLGASLDRLKLRVEALEKMPRVTVAVKSCSCGARGRRRMVEIVGKTVAVGKLASVASFRLPREIQSNIALLPIMWESLHQVESRRYNKP